MQPFLFVFTVDSLSIMHEFYGFSTKWQSNFQSVIAVILQRHHSFQRADHI